MDGIRILAVSGSLRKNSYNTAAARALSKLAPEGVDVSVYPGLGNLPLFNPDLEGQAIPAVGDLRAALARADGLVIASPEYAHGITGVLKNALDWLVSGEEFVRMPVALINTSPRASHAQAMLREVIQTMSGILVEDACVSVPLLGSNLDVDGILDTPAVAYPLRESLDALSEAVAAGARYG